MKKTLIIVGFCALTVLVYLFFSRDNWFSTPPIDLNDPGPLGFKMEKIDKKWGDCLTESERCVTVKMEYPVATGGPDSVRQSINDFVQTTLLTSVLIGDHGDVESISLDTAIDDFIDSYQDFLEEMPDQGMGWAIENTGKVSFSSAKAVTIEMFQYSYTGGAHPNSFTSIASFEKSTGKLLTLADMVTDTTALKTLAEEMFRKERELQPGENLEEAGYWFPEGKFAFPANFGLAPGGILFYYNPYEVAAYALGPTTFVVPADRVKSILKEW